MRTPFMVHTGLVVPLDRSNIDTDAILPKPFLKRVDRHGFGQHLFDEWRYIDFYQEAEQEQPAIRQINPDFILNQHPWCYASIMLTRDNFACGSSREHAVWALQDYGVRVVIAESFGDIFYANALKNGLLPITLSRDEVAQLMAVAKRTTYFSLSIDLVTQQVWAGDQCYSFYVSSTDRECLMSGKDDIALTLEKAASITRYEQERKLAEPWL